MKVALSDMCSRFFKNTLPGTIAIAQIEFVPTKEQIQNYVGTISNRAM